MALAGESTKAGAGAGGACERTELAHCLGADSPPGALLGADNSARRRRHTPQLAASASRWRFRRRFKYHRRLRPGASEPPRKTGALQKHSAALLAANSFDVTTEDAQTRRFARRKPFRSHCQLSFQGLSNEHKEFCTS